MSVCQKNGTLEKFSVDPLLKNRLFSHCDGIVTVQQVMEKPCEAADMGTCLCNKRGLFANEKKNNSEKLEKHVNPPPPPPPKNT